MEALVASISESAREYGLSRLSEESGISRSQIHRVLHGKNTSLETLGRLLDVLGLSLTIKRIRPESTLSLSSNEALKFSLASHGAPLLTDHEMEEKCRSKKIPSKTKTLIAALKAGRADSGINTILPIFIHKNWKDFDLAELKKADVDQKYLAYQLDLLYRLTNNLDYLGAIIKFWPHKKIIITKQILIKGRKKNGMQERIFSRTENGAATAWGYKTSDSLDNIRARFEKWSNVGV